MAEPTSPVPPRVVLTMIVKDESAVIARCLESVRPLIDAYCIVDTGSSDDTKDIIRRVYADLLGEVHDEPWQDFAYNRTRALELARPLGDMTFMMDADDVVVLDPGFSSTALRHRLATADVFDVDLRLGSIEYVRPQFASTKFALRYRAVLHEFLEVPDSAKRGGVISGFHVRCSSSESARASDPRKYEKDALLLEGAIEGEPDEGLRTRYQFYAAQSWRDCGELDKALAGYERRTTLGGWVEEIYISHLECGHLLRRLGRPTDQVIDRYLRAHDAFPSRAEALYHGAVAARGAGRMPTAYLLATRGLAMTRPAVGLFQDPSVYDWKLTYEASIAAFYVNDLRQGRRWCDQLLAHPNLPENERQAVLDNLKFYPTR